MYTIDCPICNKPLEIDYDYTTNKHFVECTENEDYCTYENDNISLIKLVDNINEDYITGIHADDGWEYDLDGIEI